MVTKEGFPIAYEIFAGNTFEGHTIIPVVKNFITKNKVKAFTVVADAAMISTENIEALRKDGINYIVGARLGNLPGEMVDEIDKSICRADSESIRIKTENGYLICSFSSLRYRKDKHEMEKAKFIIDNPSKSKKLKFTKTKDQQIGLNQKLIDKTQKLLGIQGYYNNLEQTTADNKTIIERYGELYKIEQAFRISKSDLQKRPILKLLQLYPVFHFPLSWLHEYKKPQ